MKLWKKISLMICVLVIAGSVIAADWPNWRGVNYDGISTEKDWNPAALNNGAKILWSKDDIGIGFSTVSVADGRVYTMANADDKDTVFCYNADTGKVIWKHTYETPLDPKYYEGGPSATPTVSEGRVYTMSKKGEVFCLDAKTGNVIWEQKLPGKLPTWSLSGSALVTDDLVIFNAATHGTALSKKDGSIKWQNGDGIPGYSTAVPCKYKGKDAVILFGAKEVYAVETETGKMLWKYPWETKHDVNAADPILYGDKLFITSGYNRGCALIDISSNSTEKIWENKNMRSQMSGPILWKGHLYGIDDRQLSCLDFETGEEKWSNRVSGKGSLMLADGKLIVISENGKLIIAEATPDAYKEISSAKVIEGDNITRTRCWSMPILADGKIYVRANYKLDDKQTGGLVCVDVSK